MKRLFLLIVLVGGYLGGMQDAQRRIAVLARHIAPEAFEQAIEPNVVAGQTAAYIGHCDTERVHEGLRRDHRIGPDFDVSRYMPLIEAVQQVEEEYPEHYSFVHAHDKKIKVLHDLYAELMKLSGTPLRKDWVPLRIISDLCFDYVADYLKKHDMKEKDNYDDDHQKNLLSVNFSVPGNLYGPESLLRYFAVNHSARMPANLVEKYLSQVVPFFAEKYKGLLEEYVKFELERISTLLDSQGGVLVQILIPKKDVDKYVYLARAVGYVVSDKIRLQDGSLLDGFDGKRGYYTRISPYLQAYEENIHLLDGVINRGQARIILHKDLYERSDVIMRTHTYVSQEQLSLYQEAIEKLAHDVLYGECDDIEKLLVQSQIKVARAGIKDSDAGARRNSIDVFRDLFGKGHYYQEALVAAQAMIKDSDVYVRSKAFYLFRALVEKGHYYQEALVAAQAGIKDSSVTTRIDAFYLFRALVEKGHYYQEALAAAQAMIKDSDASVRRKAFYLFINLVEKGHYYQEALAAAQAGIKDSSVTTRIDAFYLFRALVEKGHYYQEALAAAQAMIKDSDVYVRSKALCLFRALVEKGHYYQETLVAAQAMIKDSDVYVRGKAFCLFRALVEKGHYYQETLVAAQAMIKDSDVYVRSKALYLFRALVEKGHYYQEVLVIAQQCMHDADEDVRREAIYLMGSLVRNGQYYQEALVIAKQGMKDSDVTVRSLARELESVVLQE